MVDNLGKSRKFDVVLEFVEEMKQLGACTTLVTIRKAVRRLVRDGKLDDAIDLFRNLEQFGVPKDIYAFNSLIDTLIKHQGVEHAERVVLEFKDIVSPNTCTFNMLVQAKWKLN
ncbi:hypothetical protein ACH5RR_037062 [Cinchona calisaya]|uniref:Pentatricopeptide repeat-containing protein n=1 Tax=Cinchona calisaya TaxID=153742 RepID=A0ABD2Y6B2_9GENT